MELRFGHRYFLQKTPKFIEHPEGLRSELNSITLMSFIWIIANKVI